MKWISPVSAQRSVPLLIRFAAGLAFVGICAGFAQAGVLIQYKAPAGPASEGFTNSSCCGSGATGFPIKNDLGRHAWSMGGGNSGEQFYYYQVPTTAQSHALSRGFKMTLVARVIQGIATPYSADSPIGIAGTTYDTGSLRWDIDLGIDANGDTVVILANSTNASGPGGEVEEIGPSYTLVGSGSTYHTYELDESGGTASLYVDGVEVITGYTGNATNVSNKGLYFGVNSGGTVNYNLMNIATIPK